MSSYILNKPYIPVAIGSVSFDFFIQILDKPRTKKGWLFVPEFLYTLNQKLQILGYDESMRLYLCKLGKCSITLSLIDQYDAQRCMEKLGEI